MEFKNKNIIIGVTGGIAAYKITYLVRLLIKMGANVKVVMTNSAKEFVSPMTLGVLSKNKVLIEFKDESGSWNNHVELAKWADIIIIAPATANTIAKFATGICDNLLTAIYLSADQNQIYIAPAMDLDMYKHPSTIENINKLKSFGNKIIDSDFGELASGLVGTGRMKEPEEILKIVGSEISIESKFKGKKVLITAGPTREFLDPVRFITNSSSGKMGFRLAEMFDYYGAEVTLITGESKETLSRLGVNRINVTTADEMFEEVQKYHENSDFVIFAAAVSDYKPKDYSNSKIKKTLGSINIDFIKNTDIAEYFGKLKKEDQIHMGFALETNNEYENALLKLKSKNFDAIILNSLSDEGAGFELDTNKISIIDHENRFDFTVKPKAEVAVNIIEYILKTFLE